MSPTLDIRLLGGFSLHHNDAPVEAIRSPRQQALLAFLVLHGQVPQSRRFVAFTFWPDSAESRARNNLRKALYNLRQTLPEIDRVLGINNGQIRWLPDAPAVVDVYDFETALAQAEQATHPSAKRHALEQALTQYHGDLLPGCYDDWILPHRQRLRAGFLDARQQMILLLEDMREYRGAIAQAEALLRDDPLEEATYRLLMRLHLLDNNRAGALQVYHECAAVLEQEFGAEPDPVTRRLYEQIPETGPGQPLSPAPAPAGGPSLSLVGRHREWGQLQEAWQAAQNNPPHFVCIGGEAGIGKTRLAEELFAWAGKLNIGAAVAQCYAGAGGLAYEAIAAWLRAQVIGSDLRGLDDVWFHEVTRLLPERASERPHLPVPGPIDQAWQRQRMFDAFVRTICRGQPLILLLDDLQWIDRETLNWLSYLSQQEVDAPLLVVCTLRTEQIDPGHPVQAFLRQLERLNRLTSITLKPLNADETRDLVHNFYGCATEDELVAHLYRETEGNPLFLVESLLAALAQPNVPVQEIDSLSPKVQAVIETRLAHLSPAAQELARLTATIGRSCTYDLLAEACHHDEQMLAVALDELVQKQILREQTLSGLDGYDFSHGKIRQVAYGQLGRARRRLLHRQVAEALEARHAHNLDRVSAQIGAHYEEGHLLAQALVYHQRAADHAAHLYAYQDAEQLYARALHVALRLNQPSEQLIHLYQQQGRMLEHDGQFEQAMQVYRELHALGRNRWDRVMECVAITHMVDCMMKPSDVHDMDAALSLIDQGLTLARENGLPEQEAHLLWSRMMQATHYGRTEEAQTAAAAGIALARQHGLEDRLALLLHDLAVNLRFNGLQMEGNECAREARTIFRTRGNDHLLADNLNQEALFQYLQLSFEPALERASEAYELSRRIGNGWNMAYATWIQAMIWDCQGDWGQAQSAYLAARETGQEVGFLMSLTAVPVQLGLLWQQLGQWKQARAILEEALESSEELAPFMLRAVEGALALNAFGQGHAVEGYHWQARAHSREPLGDVGTSLALTIPVAATVAAAQRNQDWETALATVNAGMAEARRRKLVLHEVLLNAEYGRCMAGLNRLDEAEDHFCAGLEKAETFRLHPLALECSSGLCHLHSRQDGDPQKARRHQRRVQDLIDRLAASLPDQALRRHFQDVAVRRFLPAVGS